MIKLWNRPFFKFLFPSLAPSISSCSCSCSFLSTLSSNSQSSSSFPSLIQEDKKEEIQIIYHDKRSKRDHVAYAKPGQDLLHLAHEFNIDLEGACDGSLACSTCHIIIDSKDNYDRLDIPSDEENDMLDLAFGLTDQSRLGCQIKAESWMNGMKVIIPEVTRNMAVDGYKPKPH